tara:strand:- start:1302 stop:2225 length:924 start_codon:yes stop_codon:yes gene_type:complete
MTHLTSEEISNRIPHRFENLLLDSCEVTEPDKSSFAINLDVNDELGRDLFIYDHLNSASIPTPLLTEISALACIVSAGQIEPGTFAYFAAIANFTLTGGPIKAGKAIVGQTEKISGKNGFYKYRFSITSDNQTAAGQLMAYYDTSGNSETVLQPIDLPDAVHDALSNGVSIASFQNKKHHMSFVQTVHLHTENEALYGYKYPVSHPLIKGHFPNNPVMMGVCQWQMLEDAMACYFSEYKDEKKLTRRMNAVIFKSNLTPVCEIKNAEIVGEKLGDQWHTYTSTIKKVLFKQRVSPNDQLFIFITAIN